MKKIFITFLLITAISTCMQAQDITTSTIQWNSQSTFEANDGLQTEEASIFITQGKTKLEWKNSDGSIRKNLQVIEVVGEWSNINQPGSMQYEVTDGNVSGTISIRKEESETRIFIVMAEEPARSYVLTITSFQVL